MITEDFADAVHRSSLDDADKRFWIDATAKHLEVQRQWAFGARLANRPGYVMIGFLRQGPIFFPPKIRSQRQQRTLKFPQKLPLNDALFDGADATYHADQKCVRPKTGLRIRAKVCEVYYH